MGMGSWAAICMTLVDTRGDGERPTVKARVATSEGVFKSVRLV